MDAGVGAAVLRPAVLTTREIADLVRGRLIGDPSTSISAVAPLDRAGPNEAAFLASAKYVPLFEATLAGVTLVAPEFADTPGPATRIVVPKPQEAMLSLLPHLHAASARVPHIHPTVQIGHGAVIAPDVTIEAFVTVGDGAQVGPRAWIGSQTVIGAGVSVGADTRIYPQVTMYPGTTVGDRVTVHSGVRLGSDGFGYVFREGVHAKIPHVGRCLIESDVEIGANTTIDRGSIDDTVIGAGTKIDNLVHVGHNVRIGRLCLLMAQVGVAGSVRMGDGCIIAGQVGVGGHLHIGSGARIAGQAGVFGDVPANETWSGYPARPHHQSLRAQASVHKLPRLMRALERLVEAQERLESEHALEEEQENA